jgi:hypothetical protein
MHQGPDRWMDRRMKSCYQWAVQHCSRGDSHCSLGSLAPTDHGVLAKGQQCFVPVIPSRSHILRWICLHRTCGRHPSFHLREPPALHGALLAAAPHPSLTCAPVGASVGGSQRGAAGSKPGARQSGTGVRITSSEVRHAWRHRTDGCSVARSPCRMTSYYETPADYVAFCVCVFADSVGERG